MSHWKSRVADLTPDRAMEWYRRRRATRRYLNKLGREVYDRRGAQPVLEDLEEQTVQRSGFYNELVKDAMSRVDLVLERLHRRIDAVATRDEASIERLEDELAAVRSELTEIRKKLDGAAD
ncbi:MAG TPA: hypothetical protein VEM41_13640 [Actinomycetota bacterium]|nr:hypothetical protein [Actinomycetota bacterium]